MTGSLGQNVTISGSTLTLQGNTINGTAGLGILVDNANAFTLTINAPLKIGAAQTWTNNSGNLLTIGTGGVNLSANALTINGTGNTTISGVVSGSNSAGTITKAGSGTLILSGTNTYTGATTVSAGVLNIQSASALGTTAAGTTVSSGAALQIQGGIAVGAEALTLGGSGISNDGALRNISGNNSWSGNLTLGSASTIASDSGTLTLSGTLTNGGFALTAAGAGNIVENGVISGTGGLIKNGTGTLTLAAINTYTGANTINGGTVVVNGVSSLGATSAGVTLNAGTLEVSAGYSTSRVFTLGNAASTFQIDPAQTFTVTSVIGGTGALNKTGTGIMVLSGANTYTGATNINAGTLKEGAANVIPNTSAVTVATGATYDLNSFSETIGSLAGAGTVTSGLAGTVTLTAGADNTSTSFLGVLQDGIGTIVFTKSGTGTLALNGTNTYSGGTVVNAGILLVNNTSGSGTGTQTVTVNGSGTLGGTGTISGAVTLVNGGSAATIDAGPSGTAGTAAAVGALHTGALTLTGSNVFHADFSSISNYDQLFVTGAVALGTTSTLQLSIPTGLNFQQGTNYTLINNDGTLDAIVGTFSNAANGSTVTLGGYDFTSNYAGGDGNDFVLTAVPEPTTWVAAALALVAIVYSQRLRIVAGLKRAG
ncbi:MAG: hypothetical protein QOH24_2035 [Verrucomicrobiota bacterium]|jgi:autotransporter-associated beta strand protein